MTLQEYGPWTQPLTLTSDRPPQAGYKGPGRINCPHRPRGWSGKAFIVLALQPLPSPVKKVTRADKNHCLPAHLSSLKNPNVNGCGQWSNSDLGRRGLLYLFYPIKNQCFSTWQ